MNRQKIRFCLALFLLILCAFGTSDKAAFAQGNIRITHTQTSENQSDTYLGRDLWFGIPLNFSPTNRSTKYFNIYVNSPRNTTVFMQIGGGAIVQKPVTAGKVTIFTSPTPTKPSNDLPLSTEMYTSGVVEPKAVHVWSNDADIAVYFLSRRDASSGGMYVLPATGWGKEYILGTYESIFEPTGQADWPSEFAIVANQDNTTVTIIPNWDIRKNGFPTTIEHQKKIPFTVNLNRGECVQYLTVLPVSDGECDLTGTIITSNNPIGVMGASVDPYLPFPNGFGDYCLTMLQPVRSLSNSYFTCPFAGRQFGGDVYGVIATTAQIIYRNGVQVAILGFKGDHYFIQDETAPSPPAIWTSTDPFELMQYVPSAKFGAPAVGTTRNQGDADMTNINPSDQYGKKVYFQIPTIIPGTGQTTFNNYVNIILPKGHEAKTLYDGVPLGNAGNPPTVSKKERFPIPNTQWEAMRLSYTTGLKGEGTHTVVSDTGVGVYLYGYGSDDSYSWAGALGTRTVNSPDTIAPLAFADGPCFCAHVRLYDTGPLQSTLSSFIVDSAFNMTFNPDPNFIAGAGTDSSFYDMCVIDSSLEAYLSVTTYDIAGNSTTVVSIYKPQFVKFTPSPVNFGTVNVGNVGFQYDTICNTGLNPFHFNAGKLLLSNGSKSDALGFSIDSTGADGDIPVDGCRVIKLKFASVLPPTVKDTMTIFDECVKINNPIIGNGGAPDFDVIDYQFDCTRLNANRPSQNYWIINPSGIAIDIDSVWLDSYVDFGYDKVKYPANQPTFSVPPQNILSGHYTIVVTFNPQSLGPLSTKINVRAKKSGIVKSATISGVGCMPSLVSTIAVDTTSCGFSFSFSVPIQNKGTLYDSIVSLKGTITNGFANVKAEDSVGTVLKLPLQLDPGQVINATVLYTPPSKFSGCITDTIVALEQDGGRFTTYVTICSKYSEKNLTRNINFGTIPFGGAKVQDYFEVCNNGPDPMTVTSVFPLSALNSTSFTLTNVYKVGGIAKTLPITLSANECIDAYVEFDPGKSNVTDQIDSFGVKTTACNPDTTAYAIASVKTGPPNIQGFTDPPLFSCDSHVDSVALTNNNPSTTETITAITINGTDRTNFSSIAAPPIVLAANTTGKIPVLFTPTAQAGSRTYAAWVVLSITDGAGTTHVDSALITAVGQSIDITATSRFANPMASAGTTVLLPIQFSVDKHGLNSTPLSIVGVTRIDLLYTYNQSILDIVNGNIAGAVTFNNKLWSVDNTKSVIDPVAQTLLLSITGPALTDADLTQPLGNIAFKATLPKTGNSTAVTLTSTDYFNGSSQPISPCVTFAHLDSNFSLIFLCGDSTLQKFMRGEKIFSAFPVNPNPLGSANGGVIKFTYASRIDGAVSLSIYDELGKEVGRVMNNQSIAAGTYEVRYNALGLPEGTYVYRYTLNNKNVTSGRFIIQK